MLHFVGTVITLVGALVIAGCLLIIGMAGKEASVGIVLVTAPFALGGLATVVMGLVLQALAEIATNTRYVARHYSAQAAKAKELETKIKRVA